MTFTPLAESFVVRALEETGASHERALLATRLTGGNVGRARRLVDRPDGFAFRDAAAEALALATGGHNGAFEAADVVLAAAKDYKKSLRADLDRELASLHGDDDRYRGIINRIQQQHNRRERRAERDFVDRVLLGLSAMLRDDILLALGGDSDWRLNLDLDREPQASPVRSARVMGAVEGARAALADETNLNTRLLLEQAFLEVARTLAA